MNPLGGIVLVALPLGRGWTLWSADPDGGPHACVLTYDAAPLAAWGPYLSEPMPPAVARLREHAGACRLN